MKGTINRLNSSRGFGFIRPEDERSNQGDHFFHANDLSGAKFDESLVGKAVEFTSQVSQKGLRALHVSVIAAA